MSNTEFPTLPAPVLRAIEGAEFLDVVEPGWLAMIDVRTLDIALNHLCVLGQLGQRLDPAWSDRLAVYLTAVDRYGLSPEELLRYGFTGEYNEVPLLTNAWVMIILSRRATAEIAARHGVDDVEPVTALGLARYRPELVNA